jgi:hypothetical protein
VPQLIYLMILVAFVVAISSVSAGSAIASPAMIFQCTLTGPSGDVYTGITDMINENASSIGYNESSMSLILSPSPFSLCAILLVNKQNRMFVLSNLTNNLQ